MRSIISPKQCHAARVLLNWGQADLAKRTGLHVQTISLFETEQSTPTKRTLEKIVAAIENGGVELLTSGGVQPSKKYIFHYTGVDGFRNFMDDVYEEVKKTGGEICIYNADERNWIKFMGEEAFEAHAKRMAELPHELDFKILVKEDDTFFIAESIAQYRWVNKESWNQQSQYAYGNKLALIRFDDDDVEIIVVPNKEIADGMRAMFQESWKNARAIK